jgi:hypothetical protein
MKASDTGSSHDRFMDPVRGDEVAKVDGAVAVGEDLAFQERWWTFEKIVWSFFLLVLLADVLGVFGAGWFAHTEIADAGSGMHVQYDRVARTGTPNMLAIQFGTDAAVDGKVQLIVSDSIVKALGAQRVIPQPESSTITAGGMLYNFPSGTPPGEVDFELQPAAPGIYSLTLQVRGHAAVSRRVVVLP